MSDRAQPGVPVARIQRRLRAEEALIEMVRAERVFHASRKQVVDQVDIAANFSEPTSGTTKMATGPRG
jgi:hypothetical protein